MPGPVNPVDPATLLGAFLRLRSRDGAQQTAPALSGVVTPSQRQPKRGQSVEELLARRIARIDRRAPDARRALVCALVEASLLHEWGESLMAAPQFADLVESVASTLLGSPQWAADIDRLLASIQVGL